MNRKQFRWLKMIFTGASFIIAFIFKSEIDWNNLGNNEFKENLVNEFVFSIAVSIFASMILVWFIDEIEKNIQDKKNRDDEKAAIKRFDKVLSLYLERYIILFYCVSTPLLNRDFNSVEMPMKFSLKDMRDLHYMTTLIKESFSNSSVEAFLQSELQLRKEIISITEKYSFEYYPKFSELFTEFVRVSLRYDTHGAIIFNQRTDKDIEFIKDLLENHADEYLSKMLSGEHLHANAAHPYIFLYLMMNEQRDIILKYQKALQELEKE